MSSPVKLASPYPTIEDAADVYGISSTRLQRLKNMVQRLLPQSKSKIETVVVSSSANERSSATSKSAASRSRAKKSSQHAHSKKRVAKSK